MRDALSSCDFFVEAPDASLRAPRATVESLLESLPGVRQDLMAHGFSYGRPPGLLLQMWIRGKDDAQAVDLSLYGNYNCRDNTALALVICSRIAGQLGWQVCDGRTEQPVDPITLNEALVSQRRSGHTADDILAKRSRGDATFFQCLHFYWNPAPIGVLIVALLLPFVAPVFIMCFFDPPVGALICLAVAFPLLVLGMNAVIRSILYAAHPA